MSFNADTFDYEAEFRKIAESVRKPNILVIGACGAGKSSFIDRIFGSRVGRPGPGASMAHGIYGYPSEGIGVALYESEGYEKTEGDEVNALYRENVTRFVDDFLESGKPGARIHEVYYCISVQDGAVANMDLEVIREIQVRDVPVAAVFTKIDCIGEDELAEIAAAFEVSCPGVAYFNTCTIRDRRVLDVLKPRQQWEDILNWAFECLDASLREGLVSSVVGALRQNRIVVVKKVIPVYAAIAVDAASAADPADVPAILAPVMARMSMHIMNAFGMNDDIKEISSSARIVAANLPDLMALAGNKAGAAGRNMGSATAASFAADIGGVLCEICFRYVYAAVIERRSVEMKNFFSLEAITSRLGKF